MTKNRTPTPVYLDSGMHSGLEVKGLTFRIVCLKYFRVRNYLDNTNLDLWYTFEGVNLFGLNYAKLFFKISIDLKLGIFKYRKWASFNLKNNLINFCDIFFEKCVEPYIIWSNNARVNFKFNTWFIQTKRPIDFLNFKSF